jgi:uncharacterized RDD family membrane protein YckC
LTLPVPERSHGEETRNPPEDSSPVTEAVKSWRKELSGRVRDFRLKRARLRNEPASLDFDFEPTDASALLEAEREETPGFPPNARTVERGIASPASEQDRDAHPLEAEALDRDAEDVGILDSAMIQAEENVLEPLSPADNRMEIVVGPAEADMQEVALATPLEALPLASIGRRFLAGLADGLVLLVGAGLFALIFWKAGGHMTPLPMNLAIAALIAAIFILAYFGLFTALTFSTPGLTWMGIEVRNLEGAPPTTQESVLRAFGYLVSASALMIGFLWAVVDSEWLTWHDRISGTFLTPVSHPAPVKDGKGLAQESASEL